MLINVLGLVLTLERQNCHNIETSQSICRANQMTGSMIATSEYNDLNVTFVVTP